MGEIALRHEDRIGLAAAIVLHGALAAVLLMQTVRSEVSVFPERMTVSLVTEVGLENAAPDPVSESRAAIAPTLAEQPAAPPPPQPARPERAERTPPAPQPQPTRAVRPTPAPTQPAPPRDRSRPDRTPAPAARSTPAPKPSSAPAKPATKTGGSRIGDDFLDGKGSSTTTNETRAPAAAFGSAERAALSSAITRQLRPHWTAPSGLEAELLISTVSWDLNRDGTLRGTPRCRTDPGSITESNRPQASLHCERAIRAVQRAAPFNLPDQFYDRWKALEWQFDRRL
jgi:outer membrane biosynthesis protein TonB